MTKLGVHGESPEEKEKSEAGETVKVDPKVFTVLQPTVIPIPPPPPAPPRRSAAGILIRGLLLFLLFVACFTAGLVLIYGVDTVYTGIFGVFKADEAQPTTTAAPEQFGLVNPMGMSQKSDEKGSDDEVKIFLNSVPVAKVMVIEGGNNVEGKDSQMKENERPIHPYEAQEAPLEAFNRPVMNIPPPLLALQARQMAYAQVKIFLNSVPVAKVMVIEGGNNVEGKDSQMKENERPIHPYEAQEAPLEAFNRPVMNIPPPLLALQARQMAYAQAVRQWRMRRLQQAIYEQQMLREAMMRAEWMEHQRRAALEDELARSIAQARWEQTQRAKAAEEYQAEMQRAQWAQAQRAMWERAQMAQQMQQMHNMHHQTYWQHPCVKGISTFQQPQWVNNQQPQQQPQQQPAQTNIAFPRIIAEHQEPQIPMRPHDASPAQILSMQQPTVPPAPEMAMHDKIYQEMQKKSQGMEFNAPNRPIWTAITPTPETPGNYDHDAIFQENLRKIQEQQTSTIAPVTPSTEKIAEIKQVESDNVFRDILSVFDEAEKKEETVPTTTENVFKAFDDDKPAATEAPKTVKEPTSDVVDSAAQVEASTENIFKAVESQKPEDSIFKIVEEQKPEVIVPEEQKPEITVVEEPKPEMNVFKPVEQPKSEEIHVPDPDEDDGPAGPVVVEDRFPRIEDRTTVPVEGTTVAAPEQGNDEDMEHDPLAAFLRYFEQEAQKINEARAKPAVVDSEVHKQDMPPAVDEPEPHFEEFQRPQQVPRLKKSQGMEFNAPNRPIWTAITPTPETPGNYDHDAIFQENLRKIQEQQTSTIAPVTPSTEKIAEIKQVESDNVFRDILSVFDEAEKKEETVPTTTENVFKAFDDDKPVATEAPKTVKEPTSDVVDSAAQVEASTENIFKAVESQKPEDSIFKIVEEQKPEVIVPEEQKPEISVVEEPKPEMNVFKPVEQPKSEEIHVIA
ncbi:hypothetical protein ANCCAN_11288 [Ancylostoma caninum]|uniref:Uncharacterized protein n=1 Tax=Ancylostoma caninum TaxID=29170 RepID=A0A368GI56_ANCCA|nr:hypothetical protein ANCCAN_11288 [Ancylostoma caninum]